MLNDPDKLYKWKILVGMFFLFLSTSFVTAWAINALSCHYTNAKVKPLENDINRILNSLQTITTIVVNNNADIREILTIMETRRK